LRACTRPQHYDLTTEQQFTWKASDALRVIQIHTRYRQQGGEDSVVDYEFERLRGAGHEVTRHERFNPTTPLAAAGSMAVAISNPLAASAARRAVATFRPDVVHVHNTWFAMSPAVISAAHQIAPVAMTVHNYRLLCANGQMFRAGKVCSLCLEGSLWNGVIHNCYRDPVSSSIAAATIGVHRHSTWRSDVDVFLALSQFGARLLVQSGIPEEKVVVKDNFVADPGPRDIPTSRSDRILFAGRLSDEKGILELLANQRLFSSHGLRLMAAGDGPRRTEVETALGSNYLGLKTPSEVTELMLNSRALVLPSVWYEGQPRAALEAFAAGLPVLGSNQGAIGELLSGQGPGWSFSPSSKWDEAISLVADDAFVEKGSLTSRSLFDERFNPVAGVANLEQAFAVAISNHAKTCEDTRNEREEVNLHTEVPPRSQAT
jgi:glycosyltransferase involved in cell wall biosynthesis